MKYEDVYDYMYDKKSYFPKETIDDLMETLIDCDEEAFEKIKKAHLKSPALIQIISIFLGIYGIDRLLIGDYAMGILKLFTGGGVLLLWIGDIFNIRQSTMEYNYYKIKNMTIPSLDTIIRDVQIK